MILQLVPAFVGSTEYQSSFTLTVGDASGVFSGYNNTGIFGVSSFGLIDGSATRPSFNNESLDSLYSQSTGSFDIALEIINSGDVGISGWCTTLKVEDDGGVIRTYQFADATYSYDSGGGDASWSWGTGSDDVWTTADSGNTRSVQFIY